MPSIEYSVIWTDNNDTQLRLLYTTKTVDRLVSQLKLRGSTDIKIKERKL